MADQKPYEPHQQRVIDEHKALNINIDKLFDFFNTATYGKLPVREKRLLKAQYACMLTYSEILQARIECFDESRQAGN